MSAGHRCLHQNLALYARFLFLDKVVRPFHVYDLLVIGLEHIVPGLEAGLSSVIRKIAFLNKILKEPLAAFRVMPNTAMSISESMTLISSQNATKEQEALILKMFDDMGKAVLIPESMMGPATSVASCGIAYALRYLHASAEGAVELGFRADEAYQIVAQTMIGAAQLVLKNHSHPEVEIDKVCTPGGWTIKGLNEMEAYGFTDAVIKGIKINK